MDPSSTRGGREPVCVLVAGRYGGVVDTLASLVEEQPGAAAPHRWALDRGDGLETLPPHHLAVVTVASQDPSLEVLLGASRDATVVGVTWHPASEMPPDSRVAAWVRAGQIRAELATVIAHVMPCSRDGCGG